MEESPAHVKRFTEILKKDHRYITCQNTSICLEYVKNGDAVYASVILRSCIIILQPLSAKNVFLRRIVGKQFTILYLYIYLFLLVE